MPNYEKQLLQLQSENAQLRSELDQYRVAYSNIRSSTSWRLTTPLRRLIEAMRTLLRKEPQITPTTISSSAVMHPSDKLVDAPAHPIPCRFVNDQIKRLNLVTDDIGKNSMFGGVATALILASEFCNRFGYKLRIITRDSVSSPTSYYAAMQLHGIIPVSNTEFYSDYDSSSFLKLEIGPNDIFFATSWWSAMAIEETVPEKRYFYILQEVETFFYSVGTEHVLCDRIMKSPRPWFIVNSKYLWDYFLQHEPNIVSNGIYFEPAFSRQLYKDPSFTTTGKRKLLFYARPNNPRNLYRFGVRVLDLALLQGVIDLNEWEIFFAGQDIVQPVQFESDAKVHYLGCMDWKAYAEFLHSTDVVLSLMSTPHPSYPPYDAASSGCIVVTNRYQNKKEFDASSNVIMCDLEENALINGLAEAIKLAVDTDTRRNNFLNQRIHTSWSETLNESLNFMEEAAQQCIIV